MEDLEAKKNFSKEVELKLNENMQMNEEVKKKKVWAEKLRLRDKEKFMNVQSRRFFPDVIVAVRLTKPKDEVEVRLAISRTVKNTFDESALFSEIRNNYGYSEWVEIMQCISSHKGKVNEVFWKQMMQLFNKMENLEVVDISNKFNEDFVLKKKGAMSKSFSFQKDPIVLPKYNLGTPNLDATFPA